MLAAVLIGRIFDPADKMGRGQIKLAMAQLSEAFRAMQYALTRTRTQRKPVTEIRFKRFKAMLAIRVSHDAPPDDFRLVFLEKISGYEEGPLQDDDRPLQAPRHHGTVPALDVPGRPPKEVKLNLAGDRENAVVDYYSSL